MKILLNEKKAAELKLKNERYEVRDQLVRGLILRVGKKGEKIWEVIVSRGGKRKRVRLGTFPVVSVKDARKLAEAAKEDSASLVRVNETKTVADLFEKYKDARSGNMRTWRDVESVWRIWARDRIGHIRITDLSVHHGLDLRDYVSTQSSELRGAAVIRYIRPMLVWAADQRIITINPWYGLKAGAIAQTRDRVLTPSEWQAVWEASYSEAYPLGPFIRALMLSAQRLSNVASMRWDEIHDDIWTIPKEKFKATRPGKAKAHEVPLSKALKQLIEEQPQIGPYVFTTLGDKPIRPGSRLKDRIGQKIGFTDWRFHDLRRTATTLMTAGKVSRFFVERVLGHADSSVTAVYDRSSYRDEKREALDVLAKTTKFFEPS